MRGVIPWVAAVVLLTACFVYMGGLRSRVAIAVFVGTLVAGVIVALLLRTC